MRFLKTQSAKRSENLTPSLQKHHKLKPWLSPHPEASRYVIVNLTFESKAGTERRDKWGHPTVAIASQWGCEKTVVTIPDNWNLDRHPQHPLRPPASS